MNKLLTFPLIIFFVIMLVGQVYTHRQESNLLSGLELSDSQDIEGSGNVYENGTATQIGIEESEFNIDIDFVTGFIAIIIGISVLGAVLGVTFLGSGLSESSQKIIRITAISLGLWGIFSVLTYTLIAEIPAFGTLLWIALTFIFMIGYIKEIDGVS